MTGHVKTDKAGKKFRAIGEIHMILVDGHELVRDDILEGVKARALQKQLNGSKNG